MTRSHMKTVSEKIHDLVLELYCTARWTEMKIPIVGRTKFINVASFYGISGAASNEKKRRANEELLATAVGRAIEAGDEPYLLCGDINVDPMDSTAVRAAVNAGLLIGSAMSGRKPPTKTSKEKAKRCLRTPTAEKGRREAGEGKAPHALTSSLPIQKQQAP